MTLVLLEATRGQSPSTSIAGLYICLVNTVDALRNQPILLVKCFVAIHTLVQQLSSECHMLAELK